MFIRPVALQYQQYSGLNYYKIDSEAIPYVAGTWEDGAFIFSTYGEPYCDDRDDY